MSSVLDPGRKSRRTAEGFARDAQIGQVSGTGLFGGGMFDQETGQFTSDFGALDPYAQHLLGGLGGGAPNILGDFNLFQGRGERELGQLYGSNFGFQAPQDLAGMRASALSTLNMSPEQLGSQQLDIMRQLAAPEEQRARVGLRDNLFAQGRLGTTGGGVQQQALAEAQSNADLQRQLASMNFGQQLRQGALGQLGLQDQLLQGAYGRQLGQAGFNAQRSLDRFNLAGNLFDVARGARIQQAQLPFQMGALGLANLSGIQGLGMPNFSNALNAAIAASNSRLGGSTTVANMANNQRSGIMDLATGVLGAAGASGGFGSLFSSDKRLKKDIKFISEDGRGNRWYTWKWNSQAKLLGINQPTFGVIAQEVQEYNPEAVVEGDNGFLMVNYGAL